MATVHRFEDLACWQKARGLTREVYEATRHVKDEGFTDQIRRAAVSVMSNIAEGFERGTRSEFAYFLYIAKGSCGEVRAQTYAAYDIGYLDSEKFTSLRFKAEECSKMIAGFIKGVKSSPFEGTQRKRVPTKREQAILDFDRENLAFLAQQNPRVFGPEYERKYGKLPGKA